MRLPPVLPDGMRKKQGSSKPAHSLAVRRKSRAGRRSDMREEWMAIFSSLIHSMRSQWTKRRMAFQAP